MDRTPEHSSGSSSGSGSTSGSNKRLKSLIISMSTIMALCAKQANRVTKKLKAKQTSNQNSNNNNNNNKSITSKIVPMAPLRTKLPKQLLTSISNKAITYLNRKKDGKKVNADDDDEFGDGGVWQRSILMGDKCQPLNFSGVIYYDSNGKQLDEVPPPKSPRASPLPGYIGRKY